MISYIMRKLKIFRKVLGQRKWRQIIGQDMKHGSKTELQENPVKLHYQQRKEEMAALWK